MTASFGRFEHWRVETDAERIIWISCDRHGERFNALSEAVFVELSAILDRVEALISVDQNRAGASPLSGQTPVGLVIQSAKPGSFILGADIREFDGYEHAKEVEAMIAQGQNVFSRLENLPIPTVAAIHGYALGGGLELALCCDYICALDVLETRLGFPEVKLGIFPGLGGATRATERLGGPVALNLMLTGRLLKVRQARAIKLIDEAVDEFASLHWAARRAVLQGRRRRAAPLLARITNRQPIRQVLAYVVRRKTAQKANPVHYPAPFRLIDLWANARDNRRRMFEGEAREVGQLMVSDTARNLRRLFFLTERMKDLGSDERRIRRVHVIGAGVMGGDIAAWCAVQGLEVSLQDQSQQSIDAAMQRAERLFSKRLKGQIAIRSAKARLVGDRRGAGLSRADLVIEAVFEDVDVKRRLYADIEPQLSLDALLATNTSALPLQALSRDLARPERFIGLHFFNPVAKMPLVEVVHTPNTQAEVVALACAFCSQINRYPLPTRSSPGFLVNRVLAPYLLEAITLLLEGFKKERIDDAAVAFGMPMGPIELADVVGLDVCIKVAETLSNEDLDAQRELLQRLCDEGALGKKTGRGFYRWRQGKAQRRRSKSSGPCSEWLAQRLIKRLLDECEKVAAEGIVEDDDMLDAGVVFGTGFAPFLGGPMNYLNNRPMSKETPSHG